MKNKAKIKCIWDIPVDKRLCDYCKVKFCKDRVRTHLMHGEISNTLRDLGVKETINMDLKDLNSIRVAASRLNTSFGCSISVRNNGRYAVVTREV